MRAVGRRALCGTCVATLLLLGATALWLDARQLRAAPRATPSESAVVELSAHWRQTFCPTFTAPRSLPYLEAAWLRAAALLNVTAGQGAWQRVAALPNVTAREGTIDVAPPPFPPEPPPGPPPQSPPPPPPPVPAPPQQRASRRRLREAGRNNTSSLARAALSEAQRAAVRAFYAWSPGAMPWRDAHAVYIRLYKCANDAMKANIMAWNGDSAPQTVDGAEVVALRQRDAGDHAAPRTLAFTFVREPLSRFLSGYGEISYRSVFFPNAAEHLARGAAVTHVHLPHGSPARFAAFLRDLVAGAPVFEAEHVYAAAGALGMGLDFIGRLERFDADWARLSALLVLPPDARPFNRTAGAHDSSRDPTGDRAAAAAYLRDTPDAQAAVCLLLLPDFACLGYALPPACVAEVARLAAAMQASAL